MDRESITMLMEGSTRGLGWIIRSKALESRKVLRYMKESGSKGNGMGRDIFKWRELLMKAIS